MGTLDEHNRTRAVQLFVGALMPRKSRVRHAITRGATAPECAELCRSEVNVADAPSSFPKHQAIFQRHVDPRVERNDAHGVIIGRAIRRHAR